MLQQIIPYTIPVRQAGQVDYFQISMPQNISRIVGLEYGMLNARLPGSPMPRIRFHKQLMVHQYGRLSLQVPGCGGIFFQGELVNDNYRVVADAGSFPYFQPDLETPPRKRMEIACSIPGPPFVEGLYSNMRSDNGLYNVHLYLWIEIIPT